MKTKTNPLKVGWEKRFNNLEAVDDMLLGSGIPLIKIIGENNHKQIKSFIRKTLANQRKEIEEKVKGLKLRHIIDTKDIDNIVKLNEGNVTWDEVANILQKEINTDNKILDDVLSIIKEI